MDETRGRELNILLFRETRPRALDVRSNYERVEREESDGERVKRHHILKRVPAFERRRCLRILAVGR